MLGALGILFGLLHLAGAALVLRHAFRQSVGAGFMVLCIPFFVFHYGLTQFEHPRKRLVLALFFLGALGNVASLAAAYTSGLPTLPS